MDERPPGGDEPPMNRRALLAATGMAAAATLAGCSNTATNTDEPTETSTEVPAGSLPEGSPSSTNEQLSELIAGNAGFAVDLHDQLSAAEEADNVFVSPYSISVALAMTYAGAGGDTEAAMRDTLGFSLGEQTHPAFAELQAQLEARAMTSIGPDDEEVDAFQLEVSNALWGASTYSFADGYLDLIDEQYGGEFTTAAFATNHEAERKRINEWVAESTDDRIERPIPENGLSPQTVLVLTNAIYFMAGWQHEFNPDNTTQATFTTLDGRKSTVSMMHQQLKADYVELADAEAIELPYLGGEVSMVVIVPDEGEFEAIQAKLSATKLFGIFEALAEASGDLRMPKFEFGFDVELDAALKGLGMGAAFGSGADFSNMVDSGHGPGIDDVFHNAVISVDEEGTEAAAATAVGTRVSGTMRPFDLTLDRPFLFCIRDRPTDAVLFFGQVTDVGAAQE